MGQPRTPAESIAVATKRIQAAREATKAVSQEIADRRATETVAPQETQTEGAA